jgi:hypothetical protein
MSECARIEREKERKRVTRSIAKYCKNYSRECNNKLKEVDTFRVELWKWKECVSELKDGHGGQVKHCTKSIRSRHHMGESVSARRAVMRSISLRCRIGATKVLVEEVNHASERIGPPSAGPRAVDIPKFVSPCARQTLTGWTFIQSVATQETQLHDTNTDAPTCRCE